MVQESLPLHTGGRCLCVACVDINEAALSHAMMNPLSVSTPTEAELQKTDGSPHQ